MPTQPTAAAAPATGATPPGVPPAATSQSPFDTKPPKKPFHVTRGMTIGILAVAAVAVVAIVLAVTGVFGGGGGHSNAQTVADRMGDLYNNLLSSDFDSQAFEDFGEGLLDLMPTDVVDQELEKSGITREDAIDTIGSVFGGSMQYYGSMLSGYADTFDITFDVSLGSQLSSDDIDDINDTFDSKGYGNLKVTDGYSLEGEVSVTFNKDFQNYSAGESRSEDMGDLGMCAIKIGNSWYLWGNVY